METHAAPRVISAERLSGNVIITFDDGTSAIYSASLLHTIRSQAKEVNEVETLE